MSTGTKTLRDWLFHRDLPRVRQVLGTRLKTALLKGALNTCVCTAWNRPARKDARPSREQVGELQAIRAWAQRTGSGDRGEFADVPEDSPLWPRVTSTTDNCPAPNARASTTVSW